MPPCRKESPYFGAVRYRRALISKYRYREGNTRLRNQEAVTQMQATSASITQTMSFNRKESPIATAIQVEGISS